MGSPEECFGQICHAWYTGKLSLEVASNSIVFPIKPLCRCWELSHVRIVICGVTCSQGGVVGHFLTYA